MRPQRAAEAGDWQGEQRVADDADRNPGPQRVGSYPEFDAEDRADEAEPGRAHEPAPPCRGRVGRLLAGEPRLRVGGAQKRPQAARRRDGESDPRPELGDGDEEQHRRDREKADRQVVGREVVIDIEVGEGGVADDVGVHVERAPEGND